MFLGQPNILVLRRAFSGREGLFFVLVEFDRLSQERIYCTSYCTGKLTSNSTVYAVYYVFVKGNEKSEFILLPHS
jgi:hypothetical protein